ncbi:MAG: TetR/AcrR family transcriptional regulator [Bacteroidota bacterium]
MGIRERREREKDERREEIIGAAESVFFGKGLAEATMDDIAEAAELSKGTLYLYYRSKEDLYLAVTLKGMDIMEELFRKAISTGEPSIKRIYNLGEAYYEFFEKYRNFFRTFYFFESPQFHTQVSPEMLDACTGHDRKIWELVLTPIREAQDEGLLQSSLDPMEIGVMLWSNSNGLMRLIDRHADHWKDSLGVDLFSLMRKSNAFLLKAMMTEEGLKKFPTGTFEHAATGL